MSLDSVLRHWVSGERSSMKKAGLPKPIFDFDKHNFSVLLVSDKIGDKKRGEKVGEKVGKRVGKKLTNNQKLILKYINNDKYISIV